MKKGDAMESGNEIRAVTQQTFLSAPGKVHPALLNSDWMGLGRLKLVNARGALIKEITQEGRNWKQNKRYFVKVVSDPRDCTIAPDYLRKKNCSFGTNRACKRRRTHCITYGFGNCNL